MKEILALYLLIINALAFLLMLLDKYKARKNLWRIPEATLMGAAALGGSIGALLGMYTVRHKTRHKNLPWASRRSWRPRSRWRCWQGGMGK